MTGVEKLTQSIIEEAETEVSDTLAKAQLHAGEARQRLLVAVEHKTNEILDAARKNGGEQKKRSLAVYGLEIRKEHLRVKRELLDEAYEKALSALVNLPRDGYLALVKKLLLDNICTGKETVLVSQDEKYLDEAFLNGIDEALKATGKEGRLSLDKSADVKSGFVLQEGGLIINCSFDMVIKTLRESTETQAADILFG